MMFATAMRPGRDLAFAGVSNVEDRLRLIAYWIRVSALDPWAYTWTRETVQRLPAKDDEAEIRAVFGRLKRRLRYTFHPDGTDVFQTLRRTWELGTFDCDQGTCAVDTALHLLGFTVGARIVSQDGPAWEHIYSLVGLPRNAPTYPVPLDLVVGPDMTPGSARPGYEVPLSRMAAYRDFWFDFAPETR